MSEDTVVQMQVLSYFGLEMGLFTLASIFSSFFVLKKLKGNFKNLEFFFASKTWPFLNNDKNFVRYNNILSVITIIMIIVPFMSLLIWGILVISVTQDYLDDDGEAISALPGVSILLVGFALIFFALAVLYIKWSYFKLKIVSLVFLVMAFICYFTFQIYALLDTEIPSFLGLSAVFLSINAIIMVCIVLMSYSDNKGTILDIFERISKTNNKEEAIDTKYNTLSLDEQYEKLLGEPDYEVTEKEITKYVTIITDKKDFNRSILSGGLQSVFKKRSLLFKRITLFIVYLISVLVLMVYAVIVDKNLPEKSLGYVTAIAVITTDVIIFFISQLETSHGQTTSTLLIVGMRCFLFGFGGQYWFLGYCSLYLLLGVVIGWKMVGKQFPLMIDLSKQKETLPLYKRIIKQPLFTYIVINLVFIIVVAVVAGVDSLDIPRDVFTVYGEDFALWVFGIASILINLTALALMATFRLHQRRLKGIKDKMKFPLIKKLYPLYLVFVYFTYGFAILCGILWYTIVEDLFVLLTALIVPPVLLAVYVLYLNFKKNDYRILADIKDLNTKTKAIIDTQAKAKLLKTAKTGLVKPEKEEVEVLQLQAEQPLQQDDEVPEYLSFSGPSAQKKLTIFEDWKSQNINFFQAFYRRKLLKSDYSNIFSILFIISALTTYAFVVYGCTDHYRLRAFTVSVTIMVFASILLPMEAYFGTLQKPNCVQIFLLAFGAIANYVYAAVVTTDQFDSIEGDGSAILTVIYWFFFIPTVLSLGIGIYDLWQGKWKKSVFAYILCGLAFAHILAMGIFFAIIDILAAAVVTWGFLILVLVVLYVYYIYRKNNRSYPRKVVVIGGVSGVILLSVIFICSLCMDNFNDFVGFSLTYLCILVCLALYAVKQLIADFTNKASQPLFHSPWLFPIYKYDPNINGLKKDTNQGFITLGVLFLFWIWSIAVAIWVDPVSLGISLGCLIEMIAVIYFVYMTTDSTNMLHEALSREDLFQRVVKKAWLQARNNYLASRHVTKIGDLVNFAEFNKEIEILAKFIELTKKRLETEGRLLDQTSPKKVMPDPESPEKVPEKQEKQELKELYKTLGNKYKASSDAFKDEVRLLIHFEMLVVLSIGQAVTKEKMTLLTFLNLRKADLEAKGLSFVFGPESMSVDAKYKLVMDKYDCLSLEQQKTFDELKVAYLDQIKLGKADANDRIKAEEEANKQRERELMEKIEKQKKVMQDMSSVPLKDMPDCIQKYERIVKEYGQANKKYEDIAFPANKVSLGDSLSPLVDSWGRPEGYELVGEGDTNIDPRQGAIGDCYFVSALTVAGKQNIQKALLHDTIKQNPEVGAYIVRFYFQGEPVEVIVDDLFPKDGQGEWAFCKSDIGTKLWPMLLEKAYAKLHGGYHKIIAGKVSYALSDLTDGYPEEIKLSVAQKNIDTFWEKLIKYKENGYLLGAGSPENPQGDRAISDEGIIQGHAYAVLDLKEFESEKLIQLRNPHGSGGVEWTGDWSDNSFKWTAKAKNLLKPVAEEDGVFWMSLQDFVYEYKCLYVCRIFDTKLWKSRPTIQGEWKGASAAGLPNKKNPNAEMDKNPHYGIKVNRRCSVFIAVTQEDRLDMFRGKRPIMFMVQKNGGKRVTSTSLDLLCGNSGAPTDLITISSEISLDVPTYPYTFSLMVANTMSGAEGEGKFKLDIYCTEDFSLVDLN